MRRQKLTVDIPLIVVEVLSPNDAFDDVMEKCFEYENLAAPRILVVDPDYLRICQFADGSLAAKRTVEIRTAAGAFQNEAGKLFAEMEE